MTYKYFIVEGKEGWRVVLNTLQKTFEKISINLIDIPTKCSVTKHQPVVVILVLSQQFTQVIECGGSQPLAAVTHDVH